MRLIDADALKEYIDAQKGRPFIGCTIGEALKIMTDEQPTVDVAPVRHGKWMGTVCSACGESVSFWYDCDYCPCCGARMDEE